MSRMRRLIPIGRLFFATGLAAFGIMQFIVQDFIPGRAPAWPEHVPGRVPWAFLTGAVFLASGIAIVCGKKARWAALLAGLLIFLWALVRHVPVVAAAPPLGGQWTSAGKALVLLGGTLAVAGTFRREEHAGVLSGILNGERGYVYFGAVALGLFMILCGIQHFIHHAFIATLVPTWVPPGAYFWTYFAGIALIAGGTGLMIPPTARLAARLSGLMIFLWVLMLHIPRAMDAGLDSRNEWTSVFEALALSGLAFLLSQVLPRRDRTREPRHEYAEAG